eukprot:14261362-Alexandrium_andersonii.AAC.1
MRAVRAAADAYRVRAVRRGDRDGVGRGRPLLRRPRAARPPRGRDGPRGPMSLRNMLFGAANGTAPLRRSNEWLALRREIADAAGLQQPPRSWQHLYRIIHERPAPVAA